MKKRILQSLTLCQCLSQADISTIRAAVKSPEHMKRIAVKQGTQAFRMIPDRCCRPDHVNMGNCL